jgi:CIC family chloride channel protein
MIAAATGALVSVIALDETILLNFKQQQNLIITKFLLCFIRCDNRFYVYLLHQKFLEGQTLFKKLKLNAYKKKSILGASILAVLIFFLLCLVGYRSIKVLADKNPGGILENTLFSNFKDNTWLLLAFVVLQ